MCISLKTVSIRYDKYTCAVVHDKKFLGNWNVLPWLAGNVCEWLSARNTQLQWAAVTDCWRKQRCNRKVMTRNRSAPWLPNAAFRFLRITGIWQENQISMPRHQFSNQPTGNSDSLDANENMHLFPLSSSLIIPYFMGIIDNTRELGCQKLRQSLS